MIAAAAPLLLTPQLWSHWFLIPAAAILIAAGEWTPFRGFDRWLRTAWTGAGTGLPEPVLRGTSRLPDVAA